MLSTYGKSRKTFTLSSGILPKIRKCVPLFQKNFHSHRVYCQKKLKPFSLFSNFSRKSCPSGIFPEFLKGVRFSRTFFKKILSPLMTIRKSTPKGHTPFQLFAENFISLPAISPTCSDLCAILSLKRFPEKCRAVPLILPPSHRTCIMHTVHMRKI